MNKDVTPKLYLATDHAGFDMKNIIRDALQNDTAHGYEVVDLGNFHHDERDDYPQWISAAAKKVSRNPDYDRAIVLGGSGQGEAIVANKYNGVRATVFYGGDKEIITLGREHNDTNVLSLGVRFLDDQSAVDAALTWLATPFSGNERHVRRVQQIGKLEYKRFWQRFNKLSNH